VHRVPEVVAQSGLAVDGWIPVDPLTLETAFTGVYAIGDVTSVGTPKAGVFAEGQAAVAAARIVATVQGEPTSEQYDGRGICYVEFGHHEVAKVDVTFRAGQRPFGGLEGPSPDLVADKAAFGTDRISRWFGRPWTSGSGDRPQ
jgi:sulfide:quinone oxidoreductase